MNPERILITGASGCVGQHICHQLFQHSDAELLLWLRNPSKLTAVPHNHPRITLLVSDLRDQSSHDQLLKTVTRVIHTATAWGDPLRAKQVNVDAVKELLARLDPTKLNQVIYFSTASILNKDLQLFDEAEEFGTEYIQTKAQCLRQLEAHPLAAKIIAVFPTLVFGGRVDGMGAFPNSYLTSGLGEAIGWLWLARWLRADSSFHFIHAADIAKVCCHLCLAPHQANPEAGQGAVRRLVLGQPAITINKAVAQLCCWRGMWRPPGIPLWGWLIEALIKVLPIEINAWDRFSIRQRHFVHSPISPPERFGLHSHALNLEAVFNEAGLPQRGKLRKATTCQSVAEGPS
ncbi:MAG: NAD(P)-dependent oxidoreductase [Synechococcaceae bacterium WBA_2_066]|nr:NAD(P)-dependent oxidoreductase [Synechococcaceae bacterium WBA_2_066]